MTDDSLEAQETPIYNIPSQRYLRRLAQVFIPIGIVATVIGMSVSNQILPANNPFFMGGLLLLCSGILAGIGALLSSAIIEALVAVRRDTHE